MLSDPSLGFKLVRLSILLTLLIHFIQGRLGELRSRYLGLKHSHLQPNCWPSSWHPPLSGMVPSNKQTNKQTKGRSNTDKPNSLNNTVQWPCSNQGNHGFGGTQPHWGAHSVFSQVVLLNFAALLGQLSICWHVPHRYIMRQKLHINNFSNFVEGRFLVMKILQKKKWHFS